LFVEWKKKRQIMRHIIKFNSIEELKNQFIHDFEFKYVMPFYYSNREMKEFEQEKKIKIQDLTLLYVLEYRTLEGRKR
jgi:hypothetical protein